MALIKYCRKCGENTERHATNKRCIACKKRADAAAWERKKAAMKDDAEKAEAYRVAVRERMREHAKRQREKLEAMTPTERFHYQREQEAAKRAKSRWL